MSGPEMEEQSEAAGGGVRYITEELLLKLTACRSLALVHSLNLSSSTGDKRIKFIENLHNCQRLQVLNLNCNAIERMEKLSTLTQLRELHLAHNNIQRIEGLELLSSLQHLNLSYNRIGHVPVWMGKKLHSLHTLHLQHNLLTSLFEMSRLRSLSSLSELSVSGNPASSLPHSRLFLVYHIRTLDRLDDLPITQEEKGHAHQRFSTEELGRLQREVDSSQSELSRLQGEHQAAVTRLDRQEETNQELMAQMQMQQHTQRLLEQEVHTKSQLLEKTTAELTRAFHKLYELEQELTFYKIDTKLSPLPPCSIQDVDPGDSPAESPYIGKARHIRSILTSTPRNCSSCSPPSSLQVQEAADIHADVESGKCSLLEVSPAPQGTGDAELLQLTYQSEQQREAEHPNPEETERSKQEVRCHFFAKLSVLEELRDEAVEAQKQMDRQTEDSRRMERETEELETQLLREDATDQQHPHVTTQLSSCRQLLDRMSRKQGELEGRLDDMLSRIAVETQEIKELEQQLTDGQILVNEALQRDLEEIISGLQEYLRGLREQAHCAQQQVETLQAENQRLQLQLEDSQRHCRHLEDITRTLRQNTSTRQEELSVLRMEAEALRDRRVERDNQQVELEAELRQLRAELTRQVTLGQLECDALQAAVDKEKQSREIRESHLQSAIDTLQDEKSSLQEIAQGLQTQLDQTKAQLHQTRTQYKETRTHLDQTRIQLDQFTADLLDLQEVLSGPEELDEDRHSVERLSRTIQQTRTSREQLQMDCNHSQEQMAKLQTQLAQDQDHIARLEDQVAKNRDHIAQLKVQLAQNKQAHGADLDQEQQAERRLKEELDRLREKLQRTESRNRHVQQNLQAQVEQSRLQLQDVQQERDKLLQQLRSQSDGHQRNLSRLNRKLRQLSRFMCDCDQLTAEQLKSTVEQLRALNRTVELLHKQKPVDGPDRSSPPAEHTHINLQDQHTVEELRTQLAEAQTQTHRLRQPLDQVSNRTGTGGTDGGRWCFVPPGHSAHSLGSQGTQDSGLGLHCPSSPDRGKQQQRPPVEGGYWVYIPPTQTNSDTAAAGWRDSGGGSDADGSSTGGTPLPPPGAAADVFVGPAWLLCGSPAAVVYSPPAEGGALHCNIPGHRDTEEKCVCEHKVADRLVGEKKKLRVENKLLRHTLRPNRSAMQMCDEVECVERTLLKRRAELRQADRLLLEAQSCIHNTRDEASSAQWTADVLQRRALESASCVQEATQHLRELQEDVEDLRRRRQQEEQTLREVQEALKIRDQELQRLDTRTHSATHRLSEVLSDCQEAQGRLQALNSQVEQQEQRLIQRSEEQREALHKVEEFRKEEQRLHNRVKELVEQQEELLQQRRSTVSAAREDDEKLLTLQSELNAHRAELKQVLQELLVEQQALEEIKTKRTQTLQRLHKKKSELHRTKDDLDRTMDELESNQDKLDRKREEVDGIQSEVDKRKEELDRTQREVDSKMEELDKMQDAVNSKSKELAALQQEVESHSKESESFLRNVNRQRSELQELQEELSSRREERSSLEEQCKQLEARRRHADRCLSAVEVELAKQKEEHSRTQLLKQEVVRDTAAAQEQLNESSELLSLLAERVEERKEQLQTLEQELSVSARRQQQREEELKELHRQMEEKQLVCLGWDDVKAAACQLERKGRCLNQLGEELLHREEELQQQREELLTKEEELKQQREGLVVKEEGLIQIEEGLQKKREELLKLDKLQKNEEELPKTAEEDEGFYLSTAGLRTAFSTEDERWKVELQREELRQQEDRLKARLRCTLWNRQENLKAQELETEETLLGLRVRLDHLDLLLTH